VEDRIYRSLRSAQERAENHPPETAATSAPSPEAAVGHGADPAHGPIPPASLGGFRWFARGTGADRPRISIVGTLSLSVLISAGLFAAQLIVKPRHKHQPDESVTDLRLAPAHDASDEEASDQVGVSSRFHHVHAPSAHHKAHSTHAVALDEETASAENSEESSAAAHSKFAATARANASKNHSVQHATDEADSVQLDGENSSQLASAPASSPVVADSQRSPVSPVPDPGPSPVVAQSISQPAVQPVPAPSDPATNVSSKWQSIPSAAPAAAVQVSADAPSLTIVPGRPDNLTLPPPQPAAQIPVALPQTPVSAAAHSVEPTPAPPSQSVQSVQPSAAYSTPQPSPAYSAQPSPAYSAQPSTATSGYQDRVETAAPAQSAASPLDTLDRTKVMSFQFRNAPWTLVLAKFANATGLELRLQAMPDGTFNRWDSGRYTPSQTLAILNSELGKIGCQAKVVGSSLYVVPASSADGAIPAATPSATVMPAAATSSQLQQYPSVPAPTMTR
jgi:hypothetical protein